MPVAQPIVLQEEIRRKREQQARGRSTAARAVMRSRIVLLAANGLHNNQIAEKLQVAPHLTSEVGLVLRNRSRAPQQKRVWFLKHRFHL
jgi:hypothetical protein